MSNDEEPTQRNIVPLRLVPRVFPQDAHVILKDSGELVEVESPLGSCVAYFATISQALEFVEAYPESVKDCNYMILRLAYVDMTPIRAMPQVVFTEK